MFLRVTRGIGRIFFLYIAFRASLENAVTMIAHHDNFLTSLDSLISKPSAIWL